MAYTSDMLDDYCDNTFGHTDWEVSTDAKGNIRVIFYKEPRQEYLDTIDIDTEGWEEEWEIVPCH